MAKKLKLGKKYRDEVTGFEGVAVGRFEYLNGCVRYQLDAAGKDGDGIQELIFDEQRLELVKEQPKLSGRHRDTGGPPSSSPPNRTRAR